MTHFLEIINLLSNPTAILQNSEQRKLIEEFSRLKESESGWKECVQYFLSNQNMNDQAKFFCMQVIEHYLKTRYKQTATSQADQDLLKNFMSFWLQIQINRKANEKNFLTRKVAQLFALVSLVDFPPRWPTFFTDLIATCQWSVGNADFYLKVLMAIDSEIVDREIPRSAEEMQLITFYKDAIREHAIASLVESWYALLKEHSNKNPEITCQVLEVIGEYISWIEINLIVNSRFLEFFSFGLNQVDLRETTCSCLEEILNKGMEIGPKHKLIEYMWENLLRSSALALEKQINLTNTDEQDNCDYLLKFGKLLNTIGENLYTGWQKRNQQKQADGAQELFVSLEKKLPFVLVLLNHSDDDISESVVDYCMHYISILKVNKLKSIEQKTFIEQMFNIVINKTKYDASFNFDNEGEDEAMFLEYRKQVKLVFDSIAQLDNDFVLNSVKNLVINVSNNWQMKSYIEIENALYLLYNLAESMPSSQGNHFHPRSTKSDCLSEMLQATITSNIVENAHRIVKLQYFENLARYYKFFQHYPPYIAQAIDHFIGQNGLHSTDPKLRSRVSYLFSRFTKDLKNLMSNFVEKILNSIQDLLILHNPLEQPNITEQELSSDDKLFLYETVSLLIVSSNLEPKIKAQLMKGLLTPIINTFLLLINKYCETSDEKLKLLYATSLNVSMSVTTRVSKGFSNLVKVKDCECTDIFVEILRIFMQAINITTHKSLIHAGIRQYIHRMIICVDNEILEYLPPIIEHFLRINNEPKDLCDLMPLINQVLSKYKQQMSGFVQSILMQLISSIQNYVNTLPPEIASDILRISTDQIQLFNLTTVHPILNGLKHKEHSHLLNSNDSPDTLSPDTQYVLDIQMLYKSYFLFLQNIVSTDLMEIISNQQVEDIFKIYLSLIQGALLGTHETAKSCFQIIKKFITVFVDKLPNFAQFTMEHVVPCCFQIFLRPNLDLNDAQQVLVLNEIGQCLILLYTKFGDDFIKYLELNYLPNLQLNPQIIQGLIEIIKTNNPKGLKTLREVLSPKKKLNQVPVVLNQIQNQNEVL